MCGGDAISKTASVTSPGKSLGWHWYNPETLDTIGRGGWDRVVLQDHSQQGVEDPEGLVSAAARLAKRIRAAGGEPLLYLTWAREHIPEMQDTINGSYRRAAEEIDAGIAPVGPAFALARARDADVTLYDPDRSHPSLLGTYLAACVFYGVLFAATPLGLANEITLQPGVRAVIEPRIARLLQSAAWDAVTEQGSRG